MTKLMEKSDRSQTSVDDARYLLKHWIYRRIPFIVSFWDAFAFTHCSACCINRLYRSEQRRRHKFLFAQGKKRFGRSLNVVNIMKLRDTVKTLIIVLL